MFVLQAFDCTILLQFHSSMPFERIGLSVVSWQEKIEHVAVAPHRNTKARYTKQLQAWTDGRPYQPEALKQHHNRNSWSDFAKAKCI